MSPDRVEPDVVVGANRELTEALAPFRRRLFLGVALSIVPWATAMTVVMAAGVALGPTSTGSRGVLLVLAVAVGAAAGLAVAAVRRPSMRDVARIVDARLRLHNRTTTALELTHRVDVMSTLVVHDAVTQLGMRRPGEIAVFLRRSKMGSVAVGGALAAYLAVAAFTPTPHALDTGDHATIAGDGTASNGAGAGARRENVRGQSGIAASAAASEGAMAVATPDTTTSSNAVPAQTYAEAGDAAGARSSRAATSDGDTSATATEAGQTPTTTARDAGERTGATATAATGSGTQSAGSGRVATSSTRASGTGAGGGGTTQGQAASGGGVAGSSLRSGAVPTTQSLSPQLHLDEPTLNTASVRAEAAIARAQVPIRLRTYVRDYFRVLRGETTP
jgi:hypothetical protein